jgi:hypothetical protein
MCLERRDWGAKQNGRLSVDKLLGTEVSDEYGVSRPTFYQAKTDFEDGGIAALVPRKRGPHGPNKIQSEVLAFIKPKVPPGEPIRARELTSLVRSEFGTRCAGQQTPCCDDRLNPPDILPDICPTSPQSIAANSGDRGNLRRCALCVGKPGDGGSAQIVEGETVKRRIERYCSPFKPEVIGLPRRDHRVVNAVLGPRLCQRQVPADRLQRTLGLKSAL